MCMKIQAVSINPRSRAETCGQSQDALGLSPSPAARSGHPTFGRLRGPFTTREFFWTFEAVMYMKTNKSTSSVPERRSCSSLLPFAFCLLTCSSPCAVFRIADSGFRSPSLNPESPCPVTRLSGLLVCTFIAKLKSQSLNLIPANIQGLQVVAREEFYGR